MSSAALRDRIATTTCISAVTMRPTKEHFSAHRPLVVGAIEGIRWLAELTPDATRIDM